MSDLSSKTKAPPPTGVALGTVTERSGQAESAVKPIKVWAAVGGALLALQLYVWIRWITGPYFERVDPVRTDPPML